MKACKGTGLFLVAALIVFLGPGSALPWGWAS
jgi:hypothetical protein